MSFHVAVGNRNYYYNDAQVEYRLHMLERYDSYREDRNDNIITAVIRAVAHFFNWLSVVFTFGSVDNARLFRRSIKPQIQSRPTLWAIYENARRYRKMRPVVVASARNVVATPARNVAAPVYTAQTSPTYFSPSYAYPSIPVTSAPVAFVPLQQPARDVAAPARANTGGNWVAQVPVRREPEERRDRDVSTRTTHVAPRNDRDVSVAPRPTPVVPRNDRDAAPRTVSGNNARRDDSSSVRQDRGTTTRIVPNDDPRRPGSGHVQPGNDKRR